MTTQVTENSGISPAEEASRFPSGGKTIEAGEGATEHAAATPEQIAEARVQGWRPRDEFVGPADEYVEAGEFLDRAKHINPILNSKLSRTEAQLRKAQEEIANLQKDSRQALEMQRNAMQRDFDAKIAQAQRKRAEAVQNADGTAFAAAESEIATLQKDAPKALAPETPVGPSKELLDASNSFLQRNDWFTKDERKNRMAAVESELLLKDRPDLKNNPDFFPALEARMQKVYPELFGNSARKGDSIVDGGGSPTGVRSSGAARGFRDLSKDAQEAARRQVKGGFFKTVDEYAKAYFETYGDE